MTGRPVFPRAQDMSEDWFCKHWNKRHSHLTKDKIPLGEGPTDRPHIINMFRSYHDTIHRLEVTETFDHEHDSKPRKNE